MAASKHKCRPRTLTMMGGPIYTRTAPTAVNQHATTRPHACLQENVIATVPAWYQGARRRVPPGFLQPARFMPLQLCNPMLRPWEFFIPLVHGIGQGCEKTKKI